MDLQTALSSTQSPDFKGLPFPGARDLGRDSLSGDDRFGEYLRRALGNDGTVSTDSPKHREAPETGYTEEPTTRSEDTQASEADAETVQRGSSREETPSEKGTDKSGEKEPPSADAKTRGSNESGDKNPKRSEEASEDTKIKSGKAGGSEKSPVPEGAETRKTRDESADAADGDEEAGDTGENSARRTLAREPAAPPKEIDEKDPEASAFMARGDRSETARHAGAETVRKSDIADTGHAAGGDAGNKNTRDHKEPSFTVVDLRTRRGREGAKHRSERTEGSTHESSRAGKETFKGSVDRAVLGEERSADSVRLVRPEGESTIGREFSEKSQPRPGLSQDQQALFRNMRESGNGEIVKRTGIILKDNSSGEIRMDLKPEKLGKVRVQIHLKDNTLSGRIIVESSAVREVFESNMEALHRAFKESGFESAELDVQVGGGRQQEHQGSQKHRPRTAENIRTLEEHVYLARDGGYSDGVIDLVV